MGTIQSLKVLETADNQACEQSNNGVSDPPTTTRGTDAFGAEDIAADVLQFFQSRGLPVGDDSQNQVTIRKELSDYLSKKHPEFKAIDLLRRWSSTSVDCPSVKYKDSGLDLVTYLRRHFPLSIAQGYLPVSEIDDKDLRRRISIEKARGNFPSSLRDVCLTKYEILSGLRGAVAKLANVRDEKSTQYQRLLYRLTSRKS